MRDTHWRNQQKKRGERKRITQNTHTQTNNWWRVCVCIKRNEEETNSVKYDFWCCVCVDERARNATRHGEGHGPTDGLFRPGWPPLLLAVCSQTHKKTSEAGFKGEEEEEKKKEKRRERGEEKRLFPPLCSPKWLLPLLIKYTTRYSLSRILCARSSQRTANATCRQGTPFFWKMKSRKIRVQSF